MSEYIVEVQGTDKPIDNVKVISLKRHNKQIRADAIDEVCQLLRELFAMCDEIRLTNDNVQITTIYPDKLIGVIEELKEQKNEH